MRSGFVSILGRPNAGKSTLLNALVGEKVAIVTSKPQTTRNRITGVLEVPAGKAKRPAAQIVFVDTPGVHKPGSQLDRRMLQEVYDALETRDIVILLVDASREMELSVGSGDFVGSPVSGSRPGTSSSSEIVGSAESGEILESPVSGSRPGAPTDSKVEGKRADRVQGWRSEDEFVLNLVRKLDCPVFLVINKIDLIRREQLLPLIDSLMKQFAFKEVIPISAKKRDGLDQLIEKLVEYLPTGERYYPPEQFTDQPERFLVAELIRERILMETGEEVPYASAVVIEKFEEPPPEPEAKPGKVKKPRPLKGGGFAEVKLPVTSISAVIYCERDGQKAILIGKGGAKLKAIGTSARKEIESLLGTRVYLELHVIVEEGWRESRGFIDTLDWRKQLEDLAARQADVAEEK